MSPDTFTIPIATVQVIFVLTGIALLLFIPIYLFRDRLSSLRWRRYQKRHFMCGCRRQVS